MHGRLKVRSTEEEKKRKEEERAKKVVAYQHFMQNIFSKRTECQFDKELLDLISQVLVSNPDIYTLWNIRREVCLTLSKSSDDDNSLSKLFNEELNLTEHCLKINPKSYCAWHHRVWVLNTRDDSDWKKEIDLCNYYLKIDERNFHCWDYRRHVVQKANISLKEEFDFTTEKIKDNFSNYSSWHYRSKLLVKQFPDIQGERPIHENNHRDELEMVLNAAFTDPNDTSAWFYQRWLLGGIKNEINLSTCTISEWESLICFTHDVKLNFVKENIKIRVNNEEISGEWFAVRGLHSDVAWIFKHNSEIVFGIDNPVLVEFKNNYLSTHVLECYLRNYHYIGIPKPSFRSKYGSAILEELEKQLDSCQQLLDLEPDSKWTLLTNAVIMYALDAIKYHKDIIEIMKSLICIDCLRAGYYYDLMSKWTVEFFLEKNSHVFQKSDEFSGFKSDFPLSSLYHLQYFSGCRVIDLSNNKITSRSLPLLLLLRCCEDLDLSQNEITSLQGFPAMCSLRILHLDGDKFSIDDLQCLTKCLKLNTINLKVKVGTEDDFAARSQVFKDNIPQVSNINILTY